jgi:Flp pilus assembly protein TadG
LYYRKYTVEKVLTKKQKMQHIYSKLWKNKKGATAIEFALLAPVFFLLLMGVMEFSFIMLRMVMAENALRQAARQSIVAANTADTIQTRVVEQTQRLIDFSNTSTSCVCITAYTNIASLNAARGSSPSSCGACRPGNSTPATPNAVVNYELIYRHVYITPIGGLIGIITGASVGGWEFLDLRTSTVVTNEPF